MADHHLLRHPILTTLLIVSLSVALVDTILSLLRNLSPSTVHCNWFLPLAILSTVFLFATAVLFSIVSFLGKIFNMDRQALVSATASFLLFFFFPALLNDLLHFDLSISQWILLCSLLALAFLASTCIYIGLTSSRLEPRIYHFISSSSIVPILLAEVVILIWIRRVHLIYIGWIKFIAFLFFFAFTFYLLRRYRSGAIRTYALVLLFVLICASAFLPSFHKDRGIARKPSSNHSIKHVILITIDTLRADALSCYSKSAPKTPNIDQFAEHSILFREVISPSPWTYPALASIMTGVSPLVHDTTRYDSQIPRNLPMLAEYMGKAGYKTASIGKNVFLQKNFARGFSSFEYYPRPQPVGLGASIFRLFFGGWCRSEISTMEITALAEGWVGQHASEDFFLWIHYFDPHLPYAPPRSYLMPEEPESRIGPKCSIETRDRIRDGTFSPSMAERKRVESLYHSEVRYVDDAVGRFMQMLKERNIYDDALIILSSDHGEEFWEHGDIGHGQSVYDELLRVPLLVKLPGAKNTQEISQRVTTIAITPTILDISGIRYTPESFSVPSLAALWKETNLPLAQPTIVSTGLMYFEDRVSVTFDHYKYIRNLVTGHEQIFDLQVDPKEINSLASPALMEEAKQQLSSQQKEASILQRHYGIQTNRTKLDMNTLEMMKSLGYVIQ